MSEPFPSRSPSRRGRFHVQSAIGLVLLLALIGLKVWYRAERRKVHTPVPAGIDDREAVVIAALDDARKELERKNYDMALISADMAIRLDPKRGTAHFFRAMALRGKGDLPEALKAADEARALQPGDDGVHFLRGVILSELKRFPEAEDALTQALAIDAANPEALMLRGQARVSQEEWGGAEEDFLEALKIAPEDWKGAGKVKVDLEEVRKQRKTLLPEK